jgi:hypothetical protein
VHPGLLERKFEKKKKKVGSLPDFGRKPTVTFVSFKDAGNVGTEGNDQNTHM